MSDQKLSRDAILRILLRLITAKQDVLIARGAIAESCAIDQYLSRCTVDDLEEIVIDEGQLGFDSLSRLELALEVSRFFNLHMSGVDDYLLVKRRISDWIRIVETHFALVTSDPVITFETSGSTGQPKRVDHTLSALEAEVSNLLIGPLAQWPTGGRILAMVPPHHIYGFIFTCILPTHAGAKLIDLSRSTPTKAFATAAPGDLIIATPYIWDLITNTGLRFEEGVVGICSTAPSTETTWRVRDTAGLSKLVEVYGATETGGVGFRSSPNDAFSLMPHLSLSAGLVTSEARNSAALPIQDKLNWVDDRRFYVLGRIDDVVQVAGVNVSLSSVATTLSEVDAVAAIDVQMSESRLEAVIVPNQASDDHDTILSKVRAHALKMLPPTARPAEYSIRECIPQNKTANTSGRQAKQTPLPTVM